MDTYQGPRYDRSGKMTLMATESARTRTQFADLVRTRRKELRLSLRALQDKTIDQSTGQPAVKYGWVDRLEKGQPVIPPQLPELEALALALEVPLGRVQDAASAQFFGIDTISNVSGTVRALASRADRMTPEQLEQLVRLLDAFAPPE